MIPVGSNPQANRPCDVMSCRSNGLVACLPVALLHGFGYLLGYVLPRLLKFSEKVSRTVSIETGNRASQGHVRIGSLADSIIKILSE